MHTQRTQLLELIQIQQARPELDIVRTRDMIRISSLNILVEHLIRPGSLRLSKALLGREIACPIRKYPQKRLVDNTADEVTVKMWLTDLNRDEEVRYGECDLVTVALDELRVAVYG